ncbi:MAG: DUF3095 domain-containing protein [Paracoccaceae bacterium]
MLDTDTARTLAALPAFTRFEDVADPSVYRPLPDDWALAVADVVSSTAAIREGRYKSVNMAGAAVISAVLNGVGLKSLPFVFGGDGACVAIPPEGLVQARAALADVRTWVQAEMQLEMRTALVPVSAIRAAAHDVRVARFQASGEVGYAMFAGGGASWAEAQMKAGAFAVPGGPAGSRPDLTGLSCRWNPVTSRNGQIVSIIVLPGAAGYDVGFAGLVAEVVALSGEGASNPVPESGPPLKLSWAGVVAEARLSKGLLRQIGSGLRVLFMAALMILLHRTNRKLGEFDAREYASDIARNADFRKFDDGLKMTVDVTPDQAARIEARLQAAQAAGLCRYGLHAQDKALMTCIVPTPMTRDHMHFVDGGSGGYAEAAKRLKAGA